MARGAAEPAPEPAPDDSEAAEPHTALTIVEAIETGDELETLRAVQFRLATACDSPKCSTRDLAALTRRLLEVNREIAGLESENGEDDIGAAAATPDEELDLDSL